MYGIRGISNKWFRYYLTNRTQFVSYKESTSSTARIQTGFPQGSVLGPLLFLIYINDLQNAIKRGKASLFDDTSILFSSNLLANLEIIINSDLSNVFIWLCAKKISLNISKTEVLIFRNPHKNIDRQILY